FLLLGGERADRQKGRLARPPFLLLVGGVLAGAGSLTCPPPLSVCLGRDTDETTVPDFIRAEPELAPLAILRPAHPFCGAELIDRLGSVAGRQLFRLRLAVALGLRVRFRGVVLLRYLFLSLFLGRLARHGAAGAAARYFGSNGGHGKSTSLNASVDHLN